MKTVKLGTAQDLERFLRILAEESINVAKNDMQKPAEKQRQKTMARQIRMDKAELSEDEEPPEAPAEVPAESPPAEEPAAPTDKPEKKPAAPTPGAMSAADINPTISSVIDAIKEIRGGKGASDSAVETELIAYFDRLEEAEKTALVVMLRSLGGIMRQQLVGTEAPEPADYQIFTSMKPGEKSKSAETKPIESETEEIAPETSPEASSGENTTPPIKVGEPVTEAYRTKIRDLLYRNR